jgi:hypothetical protein
MFNSSHHTPNNGRSNSPKPRTIQELYPDFTREEQAEAEDTLRRYLDLVWRIYRRIRGENPEKIDENPFKR